MLTWHIDEIERAAGLRPSEREIKEELERAVSLSRLRYIKRKSHQIAGYYPFETPLN